MSPSIEALQEQFHLPGVAEIVAGEGGLPKIRVTAASVSAEIYLHGAQVTSWRPQGSEEVLFVSAASRWEHGRAIRGGIPICFPWFRGKADDAKAPAHGVARTRAWTLKEVAERDGAVEVMLTLASDETTRQWFAHDFDLEYRVSVGRELGLSLTVANTGSTPFRFEEALHTYFLVADAQQIRITGLAGLTYLDNMDGNKEKVQGPELALTQAIDSAYLGSDGVVDILDTILARRIRTAKRNAAATVIWNPWSAGAAALADLGDQEWLRMVCAEASNILGSAILVKAGEQHRMEATLSVFAASSI